MVSQSSQDRSRDRLAIQNGRSLSTWTGRSVTGDTRPLPKQRESVRRLIDAVCRNRSKMRSQAVALGYATFAVQLPLLAQITTKHPTPVVWFKLIGSLALLAIGGIGLVVWAWLTMRVGRRSLKRLDTDRVGIAGRGTRIDSDDWAGKPLHPPVDGVPPGQDDTER